MHSVLDVIALSSIAYVGTMFDNYFAFVAQLVVTEPTRYRRVSIAQAVGVAILVIVAAAVGSALTAVPVQWTGLFCLAPWSMAWFRWRHRDEHATATYRRGALTTTAVTIALGGDNLGVWIPLLRTDGVAQGILTVVVFAFFEILFLLSARTLTRHPRVSAFGETTARRLVPWIYVTLGVLILVESRLL